MSNLQQRRNSPRLQVRGGSRMHPGWACFLAAWGSGLMAAFALLATVQWAALKLPFGYVAFLWFAWMALFIIGGKKAEKLWDRIP